MSAPGQSRVLNLYRRIWRTAQRWSAIRPEDTSAERQYIKNESSRLFRRNAKLTSQPEIEQCILEGEARLEMGLHYKNPYPRMSNMPPLTMTRGSGRTQSETLRRKTLPPHLRSYERDT